MNFSLSEDKFTQVLLLVSRAYSRATVARNASYDPGRTPRTSSRTYWWHACDVDQHTRCAGNYTGAPELSRCISNKCGAFDGRVHVWDAAAREWLLPRIVALSESKAAADALRAMIKRMLEPDPSKRPTFLELLEEIT